MGKTINVFVQRNGEKTPPGAGDPDGKQTVLTPKGIKQVQFSAHYHLNGLHFQMAICSGLKRTLETATEAMNAIGQGHLEVTTDPNLGFSGINVEEYKQAAQKITAKAKEEGRVPTVADWLLEMPFMAIIQSRLTGAIILHAANAMDMIEEGGTGNVFFASHSPTGEMAALEPQNATLLNEADIICYTVVMEDDGKIQIVACRYYPCVYTD